MTVGELCLLVEAGENSPFLYNRIWKLLDKNAKEKSSNPDKKLPLLSLPLEVFDDMVDSLSCYESALEDGEKKDAVKAFLRRLNEVEEID